MIRRRHLPLLLVGFLLGANPASAADDPAAVMFATGQGFRRSQRYEEARILFEDWFRAHPTDGHAAFELGYTLELQSTAEGNTTQRGVELRKRAYQLAAESKRLGYSDPVLDMMLGSLGPDGRDLSVFSTNAAVDAAMKEGEQAFAKGQWDEAMRSYQKAREIEPKSYIATLYIGDTYFNRDQWAPAMEWFGKAVQLDPNRETAYRYWGDALGRQNRNDEAMEKYILAVVAEPYARVSREMLQRFAGNTAKPLWRPPMNLPPVEIGLEGKNYTVKLDPSLGLAATAYAMARVGWINEERTKYFSKDAPVRHSLPEEVAALRALRKFVESRPASDPQVKPWMETVASIKSLDTAGLLEAHILLDRADAGIAQDYAAYRELNRPLLIRYLREIAVGLK